MLVETGVLTHDQLAHAVAERYGLDYVDLSIFKVDMGAANLVSPGSARRYEAVPVAYLDERTVLVAMADPANILAIDDIAMMTGLEVRRAVTSREDIDALISQLNRIDDAISEAAAELPETSSRSRDLRESADDAPVIKLVHSIIADAVQRGASDIHFDTEEREMRVRFRVDGVVSESTTVPRRMIAGRRVAHQDHGRARHRREPPPAGRPHGPRWSRAGRSTSAWSRCRSCTASPW